MPPSSSSSSSAARARPRVYDTEPAARRIRETFTSKPVKKETAFSFGWPKQLQYVGQSLGVGYASDKWKEEGDFELYLHLAESPNRALLAKDLLVNYEAPDEAWPVAGPMVPFVDIPMPRHFAVLAHFEEIRIRLFEPRKGGGVRLATGDNAIVRVCLAHAVLGASVIPWSQVESGREDQPFLFVFTEPKDGDKGGVKMFIVGEELAVEKDGIVG